MTMLAITPKRMMNWVKSAPTLLLGAVSQVALAADESTPVLNTGDTAWVLISTTLVLLMTVPGLALFY